MSQAVPYWLAPYQWGEEPQHFQRKHQSENHVLRAIRAVAAVSCCTCCAYLSLHSAVSWCLRINTPGAVCFREGDGTLTQTPDKILRVTLQEVSA